MNSAILRPYVISAVFVTAWVGCGWIFHLGTVSYSLIGIPFVVAFQLVICRRPVHQLWVRDAESFHLDRIGIMLAIAIIAVQAALFWRFLLPWHIWGALFLFLVIIGSVGFAFCAAPTARRQIQAGTSELCHCDVDWLCPCLGVESFTCL